MTELRLIRVTESSLIAELRKNTITVNIGSYIISKNPARLATWALGSCIAIVLFDPLISAGSLAHALLPQPHHEVDSPGKYVTTAIHTMVRGLQSIGASIRRLRAVLVGGANILDFARNISVSTRNIQVAREVLTLKYGIPIIDEDVGGNVGRNVVFEIGKGIVYVWYTARSLFGNKTNISHGGNKFWSVG